MRLSTFLAVVLVVTFMPFDAALAKKSNPRVNLTIKDADVRDVLTFLAKQARTNIVMTESVTGNVTVSLKEVPVWSAMRAIMRAHGLDSLKRGNVLVVMTDAELAKRLQAERRKREANPPPVRILP